jgi:hypothetical protein
MVSSSSLFLLFLGVFGDPQDVKRTHASEVPVENPLFALHEDWMVT